MYKMISKKIKENEEGFTLIELVIVISILGILAFVAVPRLAGTTTKAANSAHNANVRTLESAATMFIADEGLEEVAEESYSGPEDNGNALAAYVQKWPKVPKGAELPEGATVEADKPYEVTISLKGEIKVEPPVIPEKNE